MAKKKGNKQKAATGSQAVASSSKENGDAVNGSLSSNGVADVPEAAQTGSTKSKSSSPTLTPPEPEQDKAAAAVTPAGPDAAAEELASVRDALKQETLVKLKLEEKVKNLQQQLTAAKEEVTLWRTSRDNAVWWSYASAAALAVTATSSLVLFVKLRQKQ